jgi:hypothetical protein
MCYVSCIYVSMGYTHHRHIKPFQGFYPYFSALKGLNAITQGEVLWLKITTICTALKGRNIEFDSII